MQPETCGHVSVTQVYQCQGNAQAIAFKSEPLLGTKHPGPVWALISASDKHLLLIRADHLPGLGMADTVKRMRLCRRVGG
ncbi:hypothetical protein D3C76_1748610 [compost metagenome]